MRSKKQIAVISLIMAIFISFAIAASYANYKYKQACGTRYMTNTFALDDRGDLYCKVKEIWVKHPAPPFK